MPVISLAHSPAHISPIANSPISDTSLFSSAETGDRTPAYLTDFLKNKERKQGEQSEIKDDTA